MYLQQFNLISICLRLTLATVLGGLIGLERGSHGQPAGLRTFSIVCLGSCIAMITDEYLVDFYQMGDPARLAAQVISGIGFLGVGTIIVTGKSYVKGLTTAASLWTTAALGIALGSGYIIGGFIAFVFIMFDITILSKISHHLEEYAHIIRLYLEMDKVTGIEQFHTFIRTNNFQISSIEKQKRQSLQGKDAVIIAVIQSKKRFNHSEFIEQLELLHEIHYIEEIR